MHLREGRSDQQRERERSELAMSKRIGCKRITDIVRRMCVQRRCNSSAITHSVSDPRIRTNRKEHRNRNKEHSSNSTQSSHTNTCAWVLCCVVGVILLVLFLPLCTCCVQNHAEKRIEFDPESLQFSTCMARSERAPRATHNTHHNNNNHTWNHPLAACELRGVPL